MDMSKLPRMSDTPAPPAQGNDPQSPTAAEPLPVEPIEFRPDPANAWISIAVGVIILLMSPRILQYVFARPGFTWTFSDAQGNPLPYPRTVFFWGDLAMLAFALVLIVEGLIFALAPRRPLLLAAFGFTVLATLLNLGYVIYMMGGYGLQLMSALAVAFGVYIAMYQWKIIALSRRPV